MTVEPLVVATGNPLIVLCAPEHADVLEAQFARYAGDYDLRTTASSVETLDLLRALPATAQVALLVSETEVPDDHVLQAFRDWRAVVPTAKRIIAAHMSQFRIRAEELRHGLGCRRRSAWTSTGSC